VTAVVAEIDGEIGPEPFAPEREPISHASAATHTRDPGASLRRILSVADRVDGLERNMNELLDLVRGIVEPERSLPEDEPPRLGTSRQLVREIIEPERSLPEEEPPRMDPPRRKRKTTSGT
jgi:predicted Rdx family selenoprotein